jgi:hypothetical protein
MVAFSKPSLVSEQWKATLHDGSAPPVAVMHRETTVVSPVTANKTVPERFAEAHVPPSPASSHDHPICRLGNVVGTFMDPASM